MTGNSGRIPGHITVLITAHQDYLSEISQMPCFAQLI